MLDYNMSGQWSVVGGEHRPATKVAGYICEAALRRLSMEGGISSPYEPTKVGFAQVARDFSRTGIGITEASYLFFAVLPVVLRFIAPACRYLFFYIFPVHQWFAGGDDPLPGLP